MSSTEDILLLKVTTSEVFNHMHVVCMSQLTCLGEEMMETRFLGS